LTSYTVFVVQYRTL